MRTVFFITRYNSGQTIRQEMKAKINESLDSIIERAGGLPRFKQTVNRSRAKLLQVWQDGRKKDMRTFNLSEV